MAQQTQEHADLLLKLYQLRREPRLLKARSWFVPNFNAKSLKERRQKYPRGSKAYARMRMVISYWEMAAAMVNRGLIDPDLFFESGQEQEAWIVWERIRELAPTVRAEYKNPFVWGQLEALAKRIEQWYDKRAPGSAKALREAMAKGAAMAAGAQGRS